MKIDQASLAYVQNVVKTAELVKIGNIIIEPGKVRAIDDDRLVVLFQEKNVPDMPFGAIGLNRIDVFSNRFEMSRTMDNFEMTAVVESPDNGQAFARALVMKGKGIKVDYRCANPLTIQAPKSINDTIKYRVQLTAEAVLLLQKGMSAMSATEVAFVGDKDGVSFEMSDINCDVLTYKFASVVDDVSDAKSAADPTFNHRYPIKTLLPLFKTNPDGYFYLTTRGMLKVVVNDLDLYVLPKS